MGASEQTHPGGSGGCSAREPRCLRSFSVGLESQEIPGEPLVFSLCWNPEEVDSNRCAGKEVPAGSLSWLLCFEISHGLECKCQQSGGKSRLGKIYF